jgi:hypothetical protein
MKTKTSQKLFAYWNEVRGDRSAPRRFEIEPSRLSGILAETFLLERQDAANFPFRLAGTEICRRFGTELRGTNFIVGWQPDEQALLVERFAAIPDKAACGRFEIEAETADGRAVALFEAIVLPLTHTRGQIDRFVGALSVLDIDAGITDELLRPTRLVAAELIEPAPVDLAARSETGCQDPFAPHIRRSRIVRADRRQFRVYDGGRTDV